MDNTALESLRGAARARVRGPDVASHLLNDGQQLGVLGQPVARAHGRQAGRGGQRRGDVGRCLSGHHHGRGGGRRVFQLRGAQVEAHALAIAGGGGDAGTGAGVPLSAITGAHVGQGEGRSGGGGRRGRGVRLLLEEGQLGLEELRGVLEGSDGGGSGSCIGRRSGALFAGRAAAVVVHRGAFPLPLSPAARRVVGGRVGGSGSTSPAAGAPRVVDGRNLDLRLLLALLPLLLVVVEILHLAAWNRCHRDVTQLGLYGLDVHDVHGGAGCSGIDPSMWRLRPADDSVSFLAVKQIIWCVLLFFFIL